MVLAADLLLGAGTVTRRLRRWTRMPRGRAAAGRHGPRRYLLRQFAGTHCGPSRRTFGRSRSPWPAPSLAAPLLAGIDLIPKLQRKKRG